MSQAQTAVAIAEAQLKSANAALSAEQRENDRAQLGQIRAARREAEKKLQEMVEQITANEMGTNRLQAKVEAAMQEIAEHLQERPECADLLPDDPEVVEWSKEDCRLCDLRDTAIRRRQESERRGPSRLEAVQLHNSIVQFQNSERNLLGKLRGKKFGAWEGGVSRI